MLSSKPATGPSNSTRGVRLPPEGEGCRPRPSTSRDIHDGLDGGTEALRIKRTRISASCSIDPQSPVSAAEALDEPIGVSSELSHPQMGTSTQCQRPTAYGGVPSHGNTAHKKRAIQMMDEDFQHTVFLREPKPEPDTDDLQCSAPASSCQNAQLGRIASHPLNASTLDALPVQAPLKISGANGRTVQHYRSTAPSSFVEPINSKTKQPQSLENGLDHATMMHNAGTGSAAGKTQEAPCLHTLVASSTMGEVEMSIKCCIDPSKFHMPDLEAVFKMVEEKCLRSHKSLPPDFSIAGLIKQICQCVARLGSDHAAEHNKQSDAFGKIRSSQDKPTTSSAPSLEPIDCMNSRSGEYKAVEESLIVEASENGPPNSTTHQQAHLVLPPNGCTHDLSDISKGKERLSISAVNEFGSENCLPSFYYIPRNLVSQDSYVNSVETIGDKDCCSDCSGNCLYASEPCACARKTGGEFAYTRDGLVRTKFLDECISMNRFPEKHNMFFCKSCPLESIRNEPSPELCRGHIIRNFIKECGSKCGCNAQCGNRVVQRGITCNLQVFSTREGKGWGLRTLDELPKGAFVCEYVGELLTNTKLHEMTTQNMHNARYSVLLDAGWGPDGVLKDEEALFLDATFCGNVGRFINHRCYDANLVEIPVEKETPDHHYYHFAFFTTKKVEAFEELTWDYGIDFDGDKHPVKSFECLCGSRYCRGRKHSRTRGKAASK
uniref:Histone-lysine N-methyltransferase SUVR4 n=1 Tax=Zea mays TaxID=4577 RepID=A0A804MD41_MAIZE